MRLGLPKPVHGWRMLLGEIGIIVVGVLIALGAQQALEDYKWRRDVSAGRDALQVDYMTIVANARERAGLDICLRARLNELAVLLARTPGQTPGIGRFGSPPERPWVPVSWGSLVATGVSTRMPRREMLVHASIAESARHAEERVAEEMLNWSHLYALAGPSRAFGNSEESAIRQALARAMYLLNLSRLQAPQIEQEVIASGILNKRDLGEIDRDLATVRKGPNWRSSCAPIAPTAGRLVEAPYDPMIQVDPLYRSRSKGDKQAD